MPDPLVLDTSAMRDRGFVHWLAGYHGEKLLPVVAYTELSIYMTGSRNKTQAQVDHMLRGAGIEIEWYRVQDARVAARWAVMSGSSENLHDFMIASRAAIAPWVVVTNNLKHFSFLGNRAKTPQEIMR
jgi:predicted nucleic acid-binding protein